MTCPWTLQVCICFLFSRVSICPLLLSLSGMLMAPVAAIAEMWGPIHASSGDVQCDLCRTTSSQMQSCVCARCQ